MWQKKLKNNFIKNNYDIIIHLAAQAGVRHSIDKPEIYFKSNLEGFFNILDLSKQNKIKHFIFASTSSVYGNTKKFPTNEKTCTDSPLSFYAASKKSNEVLSYSYSNIYKLPCTGLRFFTVYGEYGRPDMALFKFTKSILNEKKIKLFNHGNHMRDFTYVGDIVNGIILLIKKPSKSKIPFQIFNIGKGKVEKLKTFLKIIEKNLGKKAIIENYPLQQGDVIKTHSNINKIKTKTNYKPSTSIEKGILIFLDWYKQYYNSKWLIKKIRY